MSLYGGIPRTMPWTRRASVFSYVYVFGECELTGAFWHNILSLGRQGQGMALTTTPTFVHAPIVITLPGMRDRRISINASGCVGTTVGLPGPRCRAPEGGAIEQHAQIGRPHA